MIILDTRRMKAYEYLGELCRLCGRDEDYQDELWGYLLVEDELMGAFMFYLDHHSLSDGVSCSGYALTDLYFYNMRAYNVAGDMGKNYSDCNKEALVLDSFMMMAKMRKDPESYIKKLCGGDGMDRY